MAVLGSVRRTAEWAFSLTRNGRGRLEENRADENPDALDRAFDKLKPAIVKPRPMKEIPVKHRKG